MASLTLYPGCDSRVNSYCTNEMMMVQHRSYDSPDHSPQRMDPRMTNGPMHVYSSPHQQSTDLVRCKRRIQLGHLPSSGRHSGPQTSAVARRNERERKRVKLVNEGFNTLRKHVPHSSKNKKMSKVDTLRSAVEYIRRLQELLGETPNSQGSFDENSSPVGQSSAGSPSPSMCSEASSPCEMLQGDEEAELMSWFF